MVGVLVVGDCCWGCRSRFNFGRQLACHGRFVGVVVMVVVAVLVVFNDWVLSSASKLCGRLGSQLGGW